MNMIIRGSPKIGSDKIIYIPEIINFPKRRIVNGHTKIRDFHPCFNGGINMFMNFSEHNNSWRSENGGFIFCSIINMFVQNKQINSFLKGIYEFIPVETYLTTKLYNYFHRHTQTIKFFLSRYVSSEEMTAKKDTGVSSNGGNSIGKY